MFLVSRKTNVRIEFFSKNFALNKSLVIKYDISLTLTLLITAFIRNYVIIFCQGKLWMIIILYNVKATDIIKATLYSTESLKFY